MDYKHVSNVFKAMAHPTRLKIMELLIHKESLCVCHIYEALDLEQANVSQHLRVLKNAGLLKSRKEGLQVHYSICCQSISNILELADNIGD
jgi:ArsR family transcriptional regulator